MATLAQRLFAGSGRATYPDLPFLYGQLDPAQAARARALGAGQNLGGEPALQNLASLDAAGGGAPPATGGASGPTFPQAAAISAPGRSGGGSPINALSVIGRGSEDFGRSEGGGFTGSGLIGSAPSSQSAYSDRYAEIARRGTADFSLENARRLAGNILGITDPVAMGFGSVAELATDAPTGTYGGLQEFEGYEPIRGRPRSFGELMLGIDEARARREARALAERDRLMAAQDMGLRAAQSRMFGGMRTRGGFGGGRGALSVGALSDRPGGAGPAHAGALSGIF